MDGDAYLVDLMPATKIFVYLVPAGLQRMAPALDKALRRGVPIASYTFSLPGWEPVQTFTPEDRSSDCKVRLYRCSGDSDLSQGCRADDPESDGSRTAAATTANAGQHRV